MKIHLPQALNELGNRQNNEDTIFPPMGSAVPEDRLFLVCDGVGGQEKGEIASALICKYFHQYLTAHENKVKSVELLPQALQHVEEKMRTYIQDHPISSGMASTLTCVFVQQNQAIIGWVGDSRIYHIRDGRILFQSKDHSQVQWLLDNGEITAEQARRHPQKNVILRAVNGKEPTQMDQHVLDELRTGDFLLLCTDGILETLGTSEIQNWFKTAHSPEQVKQEIFKNAQGRTRDNFSMYLLKVKGATIVSETTAPIKSATLDPAKTNKNQSYEKPPEAPSPPHLSTEKGEKRNLSWILPLAFLLVIIVLILSYVWPKNETSPSLDRTETQKTTEDVEDTLQVERPEK